MSRLLALKKLRGSHSGESTAQTIGKSRRRLRNHEKERFFTLDNVASNDTYLSTFLQHNFLGMSDKKIGPNDRTAGEPYSQPGSESLPIQPGRRRLNENDNEKHVQLDAEDEKKDGGGNNVQ
jgi:hypothetical protein